MSIILFFSSESETHFLISNSVQGRDSRPATRPTLQSLLHVTPQQLSCFKLSNFVKLKLKDIGNRDKANVFYIYIYTCSIYYTTYIVFNTIYCKV